MDTEMIRATGLCRVFGRVVAVESVDLAVAKGEIYGLLGPNGSGKTTTVRMLTTQLPPTEGTALVAGADVVTHPELVRARVGAVRQEVGLDPMMTPLGLLRLQATLQGLGGRRARDRVAGLVDLFSLGAHVDVPVGRLSGGLRRRVDLAVALVHQPRVLFLDEPTTGLDPRSRLEVWAEISRLAREGVTVLLTTQDLAEADHLAARIGILSAGRLVTSATPEELKRRVGEQSLAVGLPDAESAGRARRVLADRGDAVDPLPPAGIRVHLPEAGTGVTEILLALAGAGLEIGSCAVEEPSLEDVFLRLAAPAEAGAR